MAIYIAILCLVPISEVLRHIVVLVSYCGGKFGTNIVGVTLVVQNFFEIFCIEFLGLPGSHYILRTYETRTE